MFKPRDKVICIGLDGDRILILNKIYTIDFTYKATYIYNCENLYFLKLLEFPNYTFTNDYFITVKENRKQKLNNITNI